MVKVRKYDGENIQFSPLQFHYFDLSCFRCFDRYVCRDGPNGTPYIPMVCPIPKQESNVRNLHLELRTKSKNYIINYMCNKKNTKSLENPEKARKKTKRPEKPEKCQKNPTQTNSCRNSPVSLCLIWVLFYFLDVIGWLSAFLYFLWSRQNFLQRHTR